MKKKYQYSPDGCRENDHPYPEPGCSRCFDHLLKNHDAGVRLGLAKDKEMFGKMAELKAENNRLIAMIGER